MARTRHVVLPTVHALSIFTLPVFTLLAATPARGDAPPPAQALPSDPGPPFPRVGLSADGAAIALGDYALRLDVAPERWLGMIAALGASRRHGGDAMLAEIGLGLWPLSRGLEGCWVAPVVGVTLAGPFDSAARSVLRFGGDVGWQFLWGDVSFALGAGAMGLAALDGSGAVWVEPRLRASLGVVFR